MELTWEVLHNIEQCTPGDFGIFSVAGDALVPLYLSSDLHMLSGMEQDEFQRLVGEDASAIVMQDDLPLLISSVKDCLRSGRSMDCLYRQRHKTRGFEWMRARARVCGEWEGKPVLLVLFTTVAPEKNIYQSILDRTHTMVFVCDQKTYEILYLNQAAKEYALIEGDDFIGKTCYQFIRGCKERCDDCYLNKIQPGELLDAQRFNASRGFWEKVSGEYICWGQRNAFVIYLDNISQSMERQIDLQHILDTERHMVEDVQLLDSNTPIKERMDALLARLAEHLDADRAYIFSIDSDKKTVSNLFESCREGAVPQINSLQKVDIHYIDGWMPYFCEDRAVIVPDIETIKEERPAEYEILLRQEIHSYVEAPLMSNGRLIGFIGVDNPTSRLLGYSGDVLLTLAFAVASSLVKEEKERQLEDSRQRYQFAVENAGLGVWEYHIKEHCIVSPSHSFKRFNLPDRIENVPQSILHLFPAEEQKKVIELFRRIEAGERRVEGSFWMKWREGTPLRCERAVCTVIRDVDGQPSVAYAVGMDVMAQQQERERYDLARRQLEEAHPVSIGSSHFNLTHNLCAQKPSVSAEECIASVYRHIADKEAQEEFLAVFNRQNLLASFKNGQTKASLRYPVLLPNGARHWREGQLYMLQNPFSGDIEAVAYEMDIDDQKKNELIAKRITGANFEYIGLIHPISHALELRFGLPERVFGEAPGPRIYESAVALAARHVEEGERERFLADSSIDTVFSELRSKETYTFSYRRGDNGKHTFRCIRYYWLDKPESDILIAATDITDAYEQERERAQILKKALLEAEHANAMKSEFLSNVSHDMRTPLNAVLGFTGLALKSDSLYEKDDYLQKVEKAGGILLSLINDTLDLSKIETGAIVLKPAPVRCDDIIKRVVASVEPEMQNKHIRFTLDCSRTALVTIKADALRVQEILINLLSNAVKFTEENGEIKFSVECLEMKQNRVLGRITVSDNGCGISESFLPKIFEPFSQERTDRNSSVGGSGLGLSIVKRLVDLMGGKVQVESQQGRGTKFTVELSFELVENESEPSADHQPTEEILRGKKVLLCEDNAMNTEIARTLLAKWGIVTISARDGQQGLDLFLASRPGEFDAILMDIRMPVMNGYEAAARIRAQNRPDASTVPIIAMTGRRIRR